MATIPRAPVRPIRALQQKLTTATNPQQTARIQNRIGFLQDQRRSAALPPPGQRNTTTTTVSVNGQQVAGAGGTTVNGQTVNPRGMANPLNTGVDPALIQQRQRINAELQRRGGNAPGFQRQLAAVEEKIRTARSAAQQPAAPVTPPPPGDSAGGPPPPTDIAPEQPPVPTEPAQPTDNSAMFPGQRAFEPKNYEGSPLYQFQKNQGMKSLERLYAARGLTGSGAEIAGNEQFLTRLGGEEANRQQGIAQQEADRLERLQQNESLRGERTGNEEWNRIYQLLDLSSRQSPLDQAYSATGQYAGLEQREGTLRGNQRRDQYGRVIGGGGGARQPEPTFRPPFPTSPDFTAADLARLTGNNNANGGYANVLANFFGGMFG
jgi:hypothetical protein